MSGEETPVEDSLKEYLFEKHILVNDRGENRQESFPAAFALAYHFGIRIMEGMALALPEMIRFAAEQLGMSVPEPFYRGFPESVKKLTREEALYDQLTAYALTYGLGDFSEARHSLLEESFERIAFREKTETMDFRIISEEEAEKELDAAADAMLASTRALNERQFEVLCGVIREYGKQVTACASKNTAMRLLTAFRDADYARFLRLPDVIRVTEILNNEENEGENLRRLNLKNQQRKLIGSVLDRLLEGDVTERDIRDCFERRKLWTGLLHHIHYRAKTEEGRLFTDRIRNAKGNCSAQAAFRREIEDNPARAAETLRRMKGSGEVARNLNYLLSRCRRPEETERVLHCLGEVRPILSVQLLIQYRNYTAGRRVFRFVHLGRTVKHTETEEEQAARRSVVPAEIRERVVEYMRENWRKKLAENFIGRVYLDEDMKKTALPLQEGSASSGIGVMPKGSRLPLPEGNKLRSFTYWERVDDIDLSCFGILKDGRHIEFSWRTASGMAGNDAVVYSGDETAGYRGGSEYFDIDLEAFRRQWPEAEYIIFAANVYSDIDFSECLCRAGYMIREKVDSGKVFEPKTVKTSFTINAKSTYAILFALDLKAREIVWLNLAMDNRRTVAGGDRFEFLRTYFTLPEEASVYSLFAAAASELTGTPEEADVIVSDRTFPDLKPPREQIHSWDFEKMMRLLQ